MIFILLILCGKKHTNETIDDVVLGDQSTETQQSQLKQMLEEYVDVMQNEPNIVARESCPIPY